MSFKTTDGLMRHLRDNGIAISGSTQKRQLLNTGYFHGYKGYRFFGTSLNRLPFTSYDEIYATIQYDSNLKSLFYGKMMFIETAVKNVALESILLYTKSESIQAMYNKAVSSYKNCPASFTPDQRKKAQQDKLNLESTIQSYLSRAYRNGNPKITHFYNNVGYSGVPLWALFEIMMLGDFGYLLSCLNYDMRNIISHNLGLNVAADTDRRLVYKYIYTLKDLRNAIAHNAVVFDTRFRNIDPDKAMKRCLEQEIGLSYVNFKSIGDYVILMSYYLKLLGVTKVEIKAFIKDYEKITNEYRIAVNPNVAAKVIRPDLSSRISTLKNYI
ncbi:MAG: Abi family protein [Lachnospiraceae bacterium]|nr:Abi family protein [Lachnospiraceae bacterium]